MEKTDSETAQTQPLSRAGVPRPREGKPLSSAAPSLFGRENSRRKLPLPAGRTAAPAGAAPAVTPAPVGRTASAGVAPAAAAPAGKTAGKTMGKAAVATAPAGGRFLPLPASLAAFAKKNVVLLLAMAAAAVSMLFVPPDREYLSYFDVRTLTCLFCTLAVICALKNLNFFYLLAHRVVTLFRTARLCVLALVYITFLGSMLIANDMALLTFLPLGYFALASTGKQKYMAVTFILQNIAANLGGMLTPFGNPQNLYLYSHFQIGNGEFLRIMAPPFLFAVALITLCCCLFVRAEPLQIQEEAVSLPAGRLTLYLLLFALSIAVVFRAVPFWVGLTVIPVVLLFADRKALREVDYSLLLTFVFFFLFAGNLSRIPAVRLFFSSLLSKSTLLFSALSCQVISNVPSAILLSRFTENYADLLLGVNIGGVGTLIASLASLITFREYGKHNPGKSFSYLCKFSLFNFAFLAALLGFAFLQKALA